MVDYIEIAEVHLRWETTAWGTCQERRGSACSEHASASNGILCEDATRTKSVILDVEIWVRNWDSSLANTEK